MIRSIAFLLAALLAVPAAQALTLSPADAAVSEWPEAPWQILPWFNGVIENIGTDFACLSDPPILEIRVQGYAGQSAIPPNRAPAIGEVFYTHLVLSHPGNPCAGSAVAIELILPPGVAPANSVANPAFCFAVSGVSNQLFDLGADPGYGCPQAYPQGLEGLALIPPNGGFGGSGAWGMARGFWLELMVPLVSSQSQFGNQNITWRVNPDIAVVGYPRVPVFVDGDVIFRTANEDNMLLLDICGISPTPDGC